MATRSLLMVAFMGFSFVYVIASGIESRREAKAADRFAVAGFREDLYEAADELQARRAAQHERDETHHPSVIEAAGWVHPPSHRLWERAGSYPWPLTVRLGTSQAPPDDPAVRPHLERPDLRGELDEICTRNGQCTRPLTVDLEATGGIAVIGDEITTRELAGALLAQLVVLNPPGELALRVDGDRDAWRWTDWLPHTAVPGNRTVWMCRRDPDRPVGPGPRIRTASDTAGLPILTAADTIGLPESIRALVHFDNHGIATLQIGHGRPVEFEPEVLGVEEAEFLARRLAGFSPGSAAGPGGTSTPERVTLTSLGLSPDPENILDRWRACRRGSDDDLSLPLGMVEGGGVLVVDLVADGPHALVAGTTGAGKSELLRTMLLSLAARYPPDRLNAFLVDYKGGAAFGHLANLPHCVGLLTDLRGDAAERTLTALRAELRRRETLLEHHGHSDVRGLDQTVRPASLLLVVDEFATLVSEVPDFLDGMLDIAQRGRSLGIHLVLATQRPAGVISDAIRANTSLRIALRLPDADDSTDVIGSPLAAELPRELPGRALVRLDHDLLVTTQVAYSGSVPSAQPQVCVEHLHADAAPPRPASCPEQAALPQDSEAPDELESMAAAITDAYRREGLPAAHRPVPPPLPEVITSEELQVHDDGATLCIGMVDIPEHQRREALRLHPERLGGVLVTGAPRSGVSTTLAAIACAADRQGGWQVYVIGADGGTGGTDAAGGLRGLSRNASVCEVVDASDHEPLRRMIELLAKPAADSPPTRRLVILDGFGAFERLAEPVNRGWAIEAFLDLAANGRRHGLFVAVSARRRMEVPPSLLHHLGDRIVMRSVDEDEAAMMDGPAELARVDLPPGRAWIRGHWAQVALPASTGSPAHATPRRLGRDVPITWLAPSSDTRPWALPIGMGTEDLGVATLDMTDSHALLSGSPGSGVTTAIETITSVAESAGITVATTPTAPSTEVAAVVRDVVERAVGEPERRFLLVMDGLDRHGDDSEVGATLAALCDDLRSSNLRLVAAGDPLGLLRCYSETVTRLRAMRTGLLLGADAHDIGDVLHHDLRRRDDIPAAPGRGWLCHNGRASVVQVARR